MKILALDLGATTGWAYGCPGKPTRYGVEVFNGTRTERLGSFMARLNRLLSMELYRDLDVVVYERPFARGLHATRSLWGMAGVVEAACQLNRVAVVDAEVQTVKKFVARGGATKGDVIAAMRRRGYQPEGEHDADALAVLTYAKATIVKEAA